MIGDLNLSGLYGATYDWIKDATSRYMPWGDVWQSVPPEMWVDKIYEGHYEELES